VWPATRKKGGWISPPARIKPSKDQAPIRATAALARLRMSPFSGT
jgi:hypothetical protein